MEKTERTDAGAFTGHPVAGAQKSTHRFLSKLFPQKVEKKLISAFPSNKTLDRTYAF